MENEFAVNPLLACLIVSPLIGAAINGLLGRFLPKQLSMLIACLTIAFSACVAALLTYVLAHSGGDRITCDLGNWISAGDLHVSARLAVDRLSAIMICVITGVGFLIHLYSTEYMADDPSVHRYFSYLNLFVAAMAILVLGDNLVLTFVGWEGVGLCSYLLIGFWFDDDAKASAGKKAFIVNRIGDFGFILGVLTLYIGLGTVDYVPLKQALLALPPGAQTSLATMAGLFLFIGATGKSAQIPLYVWLPDAMAGPTPVSALIHAATMVTAGIYLICRLSFMYTLAPIVLAIIAIIGALTALFAATIGLVQTDIKKVLAYSTVSQLGYMFLGVGVGAFSAGFFHVFTHAFFKACLFLGSGAVIHALHHEQDIRKMGGLFKKLPITAITFVISTLAIMGFPGLSGFFSKDEILWQAFASGFGPYASVFAGLNYLLFGLAWVTSGLTSFYMWRLTFLTFFSGKYRGDQKTYDHAHESPLMSLALVVLAILALFAGYLNVPELLGGHAYLSEILSPVIGSPPLLMGEHHGLEWGLMGLVLATAIIGFIVAYRWFGSSIAPRQMDLLNALPGSGFIKIIYHKWYVDEIYQALIVEPLLKISHVGLYKIIDQFLIDKVLLGVIAVPVQYGGYAVRWMANGNIQRYALALVVGTMFIVWMVCK